MRTWTKRAAVATSSLALACCVWAAPAPAQFETTGAAPLHALTTTPTTTTTTTTANLTSAPTSPNSDSGDTPATEVVQASAQVGPAELRQLGATLRSADGAVVIVLVPGHATIRASDSDLISLADAATQARLFVVQQGDAPLSGAAPILSAFAADGFLQPGSHPASGRADGLWPAVERVTHCQRPCWPRQETTAAPSEMGLNGSAPTIELSPAASGRPLAAALDQPAPSRAGAASPVGISNVLYVIGGALVTAIFLTIRQRRKAPSTGANGTSVTQPPRTVLDLPDQTRTESSRKRHLPPPPASTHRGRKAKVVSLLDPEGYVELDGCVQRVRLASRDASAATPGEWVDVERHGRQLWAYAAVPTNADRQKVSATQRSET
jgi:hypothetical protein